MDKKQVIRYWEERFGIPPAAFVPYDFYFSTRTAYIARKSSHNRVISDLKTDFIGLPFLRQVTKFLKPTTVAAQRFGFLAQKNVISLDKDSLLSLCQQGEIAWNSGQETTSSGFVILKIVWPDSPLLSTGAYLGVSLFLEPNRLLCRLPKSMTKGLCHSLSREDK